MKTSVEVSMYPLVENFESPILDFIARLNTHEEIQVSTNGMSTQIFGLYDEVMSILQKELKTSFESGPLFSVVVKILNKDTSDYQ